MAAASAAVASRRHTIHTILEVDVTEPRRLIQEHAERGGERLSFTAYVVACLAHAIVENPNLNSMRRGRRLFLLDDVTIAVLVERTINGEQIPEPFGVRAADKKSYRQIHDEIRSAQEESRKGLGGLSGATWVRLVPSFLFRTFITIASHSVGMARRYGVVAVTAVGMFSDYPLWLVPLSAATVAIAVGSIVNRTVLVEGRPQTREHLCLTISFDHAIVDGAPATRFANRFAELLASGDAIREEVGRRD